ncbi:class I SAM-dependent methyltransferase [Georgenia deserti]|uniref:Class I SAM-dependent methyltransferase n=1 Tax=Georgenia deserti TaxID=2093781 RepID=A0ABW4L3M0_9MICO
MTNSQVWDEEAARRYDETTADLFSPEMLGPTVDLLAELADGGRALEFAIGTGRVGLALAERGVPVTGIELSEPMAAQLRAKAGAESLPVVIGDMATARVPGEFSLVYLVFNTISNLLTQDEQVECFRNAARHLSPGGRFVIELGVPALRRLPPGQLAAPFEISEQHLGFDTYDLASQRLTSHHYWPQTGHHGLSEHRFLWPAECDLMARLAGLEFEARYADWDRSAFTGDSAGHVSIWRRPA